MFYGRNTGETARNCSKQKNNKVEPTTTYNKVYTTYTSNFKVLFFTGTLIHKPT